MPNIKPISDLSDLRTYTDNTCDYEREQAVLQLMSELAKGRRSGETEGWLTPEEIRSHFCAALSIE
ncbi:MAG: hypothetical protein U0K16_04130 [Evtepia sp.]|nr:hypothetical protein [Evtepia sp.]